MREVKDKAKRKFIKDVYVNREYSWLLFNKRVLDQAHDVSTPLLERARFLSIFCSNLDEFFMVRVGSLFNLASTDPDEKENKTNLTAEKQLEGICQVVGKLYSERAATYTELNKEFAACGVKIMRASELTARRLKECEGVFKSSVLPLLTLTVLDAKHPMMHFENKRNYMIFDLVKDDRKMIGVMAINDSLSKLYRVGNGEKVKLVPLEELVRAFGHTAFTGYTVKDSMLMRVTRNADFDTFIDDYDTEHDFTEIMREKVQSRARMNVVRLEVDRKGSKLCDFVLKLLKLDAKFCFEAKRFFDYKFITAVEKFLPPELLQSLKYEPFKGAVADELVDSPSLIDEALSRDLFLSYPYDSMTPLVNLLEQCSKDKRVSSIAITIYRLAQHSKIADVLCRASENGKQVTVVIELCARFDEENNMFFAEKLKEAGCTIIYGMGNYKVHSKIISVVLREGEDIRYITHLGTGNYNESTSKQYTDLNIITSDSAIGEDAVAFFRNISICNTDYRYNRLLVAPKTIKSGIISCIDREIERAKSGGEGYILAKMNSLTDKTIIEKFREASTAGVRIDLIVRGICCLLPEVPGKTENIRVVSIVGRFLEHSRVYSFGKGEDRITYISSADLMTRNLDKRVEIASPVLDKNVENKIIGILEVMLADNVKGKKLCSDGRYRRVENENPPLDCQDYFLKQ